MSMIIHEPSWENVISQVGSAYFKLVLVVGPVGSGKSAKLKEAGEAYSMAKLNLGEELSRKLLKVPHHLRATEAETLALDLIEATGSSRLLVDNTEILFEEPIQLDPLKFLKQASCHRTIVAGWTGSFDETRLTYGMQGHPAYREYTYTPEDTFIIVPTVPNL